MAFLRGLTRQELAEATGEEERVDSKTYDEPKHCLQRLKPGIGTMDVPRAFALKLGRATRGFGLRPTSYDEGFETSSNVLTAKHADDTDMTGTEDTIDNGVKRVENTFGKCKLIRHTCTNCVVTYTKDEDGNLRPIQHPELSSADADAEEFTMVADMFAGRRGARAHASITGVRLMVHVVSLQRVPEPTIIQARRPNAITRKLQTCPKRKIV
eukprot:9487633-Pyramimonas_sp.AAC.1